MKKRLLVLSLILSMGLTTIGCGNKETKEFSETERIDEKSTEEKEDNSSETEYEEDDTEQEEDKDQVGINILENGDFSSGLVGWGTYTEDGGNCNLFTEDGRGKLLIMNIGNLNYSNQWYYDGFKLKKGGKYEISYKISSSHPRKFNVRIQLNGGDYRAYMEETVDINEELTEYKHTFTMNDETDLSPRLCFNLGTAEGLENETHRIELDDVSIKLVDDSDVNEDENITGEIDVNINQVGYRVDDQKFAIIKKHNAGDNFTVKTEDGEVAFEGVLSKEVTSEAADEKVCIADFSELKKSGKYTVYCGDSESYSFNIDDDVYENISIDIVRMMYLQRCGIELEEKYADEFAHPICHTSEATIYDTDKKVDVSGGWHDAGDYGKYTVTGVQTAIDMLLSYESSKDMWSRDDLNIPESGNGIPDVIDEVKYETDFLLKMQDKESGGVWHKVTTKGFPAFIMPQDDTAELVLSPISTTATGDFAALMAKISTMEEFDEAYREKCLKAAIAAWDYLEVTESKKGFTNPVDISTGEYPDEYDRDERYWASVELYNATGNTKYKKFAEKQIKEEVLTGYGWIEMGSYGNIAYLSLDKSMQDTSCVDKIKKEVLSQADEFVSNAAADGYGCCLSIEGYNWGSNLGVCNNARTLLLASELSNNPNYALVAKQQLDYLLGKNALSYSFVTGYGENCSKDVHHRPSSCVGKAMKGMLVGGPNSGIEDPYAANVLKGMPPAKCYADNQQSYATNEVTIYWNSPMMSLITELLK